MAVCCPEPSSELMMTMLKETRATHLLEKIPRLDKGKNILILFNLPVPPNFIIPPVFEVIMEEIWALQAEFELAQQAEVVQRLSERNCVEIVLKLIESGRIKLIFSSTGKEVRKYQTKSNS